MLREGWGSHTWPLGSRFVSGLRYFTASPALAPPGPGSIELDDFRALPFIPHGYRKYYDPHLLEMKRIGARPDVFSEACSRSSVWLQPAGHLSYSRQRRSLCWIHH